MGQNWFKVLDIEEGETVLDIGANVGEFTLQALTKMGPRGRIICIEPGREALERLHEWTKNIDNIKVIEGALSDKRCISKLYHDPDNIGEHTIIPSTIKRYDKEPSGYEMVQTYTLDQLVKELCLDTIDFMKMDVEGSEIDILKSSSYTLPKIRKIIIEGNHTLHKEEEETAYRVLRILKNFNFSTKHEKDNNWVWAWKSDNHSNY